MDGDRRRELARQYKESKPQAGVYQIRNVENGKVLVISTPNLRTINGRQMAMAAGTSPVMNRALEDDIRKYGKDAFVFEVLEVLDDKEDIFDRKDALKKLEQKWLERL